MILVTGATGLVGGHLLWHLLQQNITVVALKRPASSLEPLGKIFRFYTPHADAFLRRIHWRIADMCDETSLELALAGIDTVYHCAAMVLLGNANDQLSTTNIKGTENMVHAALKNKVKRFCFVSSIAACGHTLHNELINEATEMLGSEKRSAYAQSKYLSEQQVWKGIRAGLNAVIVNPGVILGFSGTNKGSSALFDRVRKGLPFYTEGGSGYIDVQDVVKVMMQLTNSSLTAERYILVAENCSNKAILSWMADGYKKQKPHIKLSYKMLHIMGYLAEIAGKIVGFTPTFDRSMAQAACNRAFYSNQKISKELQYSFKPIEECIQEICRYETTHISPKG